MENKRKIIIECKNSSSYSTKKSIDEINNAIKNRDASFGIFIFAKREQMPKEICPIKINDKYVIIYYDEDNLYFAYRIARLFALKRESNYEEGINFEKISSELINMEDNFRDIDSIQKKVTTILNSGEYIRENIKKLKNNLDEGIENIKRELGEKYQEQLCEESNKF